MRSRLFSPRIRPTAGLCAVLVMITLPPPHAAAAVSTTTLSGGQAADRSPAAIDALIDAGRRAARADQHALAIDYWQRALALAPQRRGEILPALAMQTYWDGRNTDALPLLREAIRWQAADEDLRYALADAELKAGHTDQAEAIYHEQLWRSDTPFRAHIGLARCALQSDRPLEGAWHFEQARRLQPQPDAWMDDHATALHWADLDDLALRLPAPHFPAAVRRRHDPQVTAGIDASSDSDHIDLYTLRLRAETPWGIDKRAWIESRTGTLTQDHHDLSEDIDIREGSAGMRWRIGEPGDPAGIWLPEATLGERRHDDWYLTTWSLRTRWLPTDGVWLDAGAGNDVFETPRALEERIEARVFSLSQMVRPSPLWLWGLSESHLRFSDANQRNRLSGWAERRLDRDSPLTLGIAGLHFVDAQPGLDHGYYSPERYDEARLYLDAAWPTRTGTWGARLAEGWLEEQPGGSSWLNAFDARWQWDLTADQRLSARLGWSDSRAASSGAGDGYTRRYLSVDWNWRP